MSRETPPGAIDFTHQPPDQAGVEQRLSACLAKWGLERRGPLAGGFRAEVFDCVSAGGAEVVVKLPPTRQEANSEAAALQRWAKSGVVVRLLDYDAEQEALLLARIRPATHLPQGDEQTSVEVVAEILAKLHEAGPAGTGDLGFPALEELYPALERRSLEDLKYERRTRNEPERGEEGRRRMDAARRQAIELSASAPKKVLLHGDVVDKNLLWGGTRYLAVDPIARIGDPCSDVGFFAAGHRPVPPVLERASAIALGMGLDPLRAQRWAAVWAVHQDCQAWRDDQAELDVLCASPELAELLEA